MLPMILGRRIKNWPILGLAYGNTHHVPRQAGILRVVCIRFKNEGV